MVDTLIIFLASWWMYATSTCTTVCNDRSLNYDMMDEKHLSKSTVRFKERAKQYFASCRLVFAIMACFATTISRRFLFQPGAPVNLMGQMYVYRRYMWIILHFLFRHYIPWCIEWKICNSLLVYSTSSSRTPPPSTTTTTTDTTSSAVMKSSLKFPSFPNHTSIYKIWFIGEKKIRVIVWRSLL